MMTLEEGRGLVEDSDTQETLVNKCIDNANTWRVRLVILGLGLGNAADAVEVLCVGYIMTELGDRISTEEKEFLTAAVFMGMLVGGLCAGYISDHFGRKAALLISLGINFLAGFLSVFSPHVSFLIAMRIVGGIGIGGSVPAVFTLGAEVTPTQVRGKMLSYIAAFWMVGSLFVALVAWIMLGEDLSGHRMMPGANWRWFAGVCSVPVLLSFWISLVYIPESPRYLLANAKYEQAAQVLSQISGVDISVKELLTRPQSATYTMHSDMASSSTAEANGHVHLQSHTTTGSGAVSTSTTLSQSLRVLSGHRLRYITMTLMCIWFTLSFGSYGLSTWISTLFQDIGMSNPYEDAFIFAIAQLPGNVISILYIEDIGRRHLLTAGMAVSAISAIGFGVGTGFPAVVVTAAAIFNAASTTGWNSVDVMSVEYFPTNVRSLGMGLLAAAGRLGSISAQFINGTLEQSIPVLLFVTAACMALGGMASYLLPRDMAGATMKDTQVPSEGDLSVHNPHHNIQDQDQGNGSGNGSGNDSRTGTPDGVDINMMDDANDANGNGNGNGRHGSERSALGQIQAQTHNVLHSFGASTSTNTSSNKYSKLSNGGDKLI